MMPILQHASAPNMDGERSDSLSPTPNQAARLQLPEGAVALLKQGAKVVTADGKQVGVVEQVLRDLRLDRVTTLIIVQGLLVKERRRVPMRWVSAINQNEIHLVVESHAIDELGFVPD